MLGLSALSEEPISALRDEDEEAEYYTIVETEVVWLVEITAYQPQEGA